METLKAYRKAVGAIVAAVLGYIVTAVGLDLDPDLAAAITAVVAGLVVERLPNG